MAAPIEKMNYLNQRNSHFIPDEDQYERCNNKEFDVNDSYKYPNDEHDCAKLKTRQIKNDFNQRKITISGIPENSIQVLNYSTES